MKKKRIEWVDMAKGYGMLLVIFAHVFEKEYAVHWYIYTFHMPLFFMLSGYFLNCEKPFGEYIKGKAKSLLIPLYTWGLIDVLFCVARLLHEAGEFDLNSYFSTVLLQLIVQYPLAPGWFLACLFVASLLIYQVARKTEQNRKVSIIVCVIPAAVSWLFFANRVFPWCINIAFAAIFFMSIGYWARSVHIDNLLNKCSKPTAIFPITIAWFALATWMWMTKNYLEMSSCYLGFFPVSAITAILGTIILLVIAKKKTFKSVLFIGENSVVYMLIHSELIKALESNLTGIGANVIMTKLAILIAVLVVDTAIVLLRNRIRSWRKEERKK